MKKMPSIVILMLLLILSANAADKTKIILIAGKDSHGDGAHEFRAGCTLLQKKLLEAMGEKLEVIVVEDDWPADTKVFEGAAATIIYSDGLSRHPLKKGPGRHELIDKFTSKGMGIAFMHFACDVPPGKEGNYFRKWIGGHYETRWSTNPHWVCNSIFNSEHPITRGCNNFSLKDEWYFNMRFNEPESHKFVLKGKPSDVARSGKTSHPRGPYKHIVANSGRAETLLWTQERKDGGRGFGFTGGHFHENWKNDDYRKLILNAIIWTAKLKVPTKGIVSKTPTAEEMHFKTKKYMKENKGAKKSTPKQGAKKSSSKKTKPLYQSKVIKKGDKADIKVNIKNSKKLFLIVTDAGDSNNSDHANWLNPTLSGPKGSLPLSKLKWKKASQEWGQTAYGANPDKSPITINGKKIKNAIGTHAISTIEYDLPKGYTTFTATGILASSSGGKGSITFIVNNKEYKGETSAGLSVIAAGLPETSFKVPDDLEVTIWAQSPMFYNPTNMDIDAKGRIWVAEGVNYRNFRRPKMNIKHPEGDRIMVLEDTDGDGKADKSHCFVQEKELVAPLGVAVIGNKVIVSQPPSLIMYTDVDGNAKFDPKIDKKEKFLTGFSGLDHDHSLHSVTFGPGGEYYFNQGNAGYSVIKDKSGKTFRVGSSYRGGSPSVKSNSPGSVSDDGFVYVGGFACRVKTDGTGLSIIGHNFRNSYEQTVSSFGDVFQNDNDDPPACRTTWLMEYGNLGFASADGKRTWKADKRPGQSVAIAEWRQEDPGTAPAGDVYGGGAPTGICLYENGALGDKYQGLLLTCESARSVVFGYYPKPAKAGFKLERFNFFDSSLAKKNKKWFRPADVTVGADGAIYIADWYDSGVGGHAMRDSSASGTIYRVAPKGFKPKNPKFNLSSTQGMIAALKSPAVNVRSLGFIALKEQGNKSLPALKEMLKGSNTYFKARAIWLLSQISAQGIKEVESLLSDKDPQTRIVAFRALRRINHKVLELSSKLAADSSIAVRREIALVMRNYSYSESKDILLKIAAQYDGEDKWYLEALGTGCAKKEQQMYALLRRKLGSPAMKWNQAFANIAWRLHSPEATSDFRTRVLSKEISVAERKKGLTALAFINTKQAALVILEAALKGPEDMRETASWWIKNKNSGDWKEFDLYKKLQSKEAPKAIFDLSKHLTADNGKLPAISKMLTLKGDAANGEVLFHGKAICASCHKIGSKGKQIGPELTGIGKRFDSSILLDSMINPSSAITFGFESTTVISKDGKTLSGFLISDSDPVIIKDIAGNQTDIALKDIKSRKVMKESIMPSVKNLNLSAQEIMDIVEFLKKN